MEKMYGQILEVKATKGRRHLQGEARSCDCQPLILFLTRSHFVGGDDGHKILRVAVMIWMRNRHIRFTVKHDKAMHDPLIGCIFQSVSHISW